MLNKNISNNFKADITAIVLTYNEEKHIERCILSINQFVKKIIIIDSFSNDKTLDIAKKYNVEVLQNIFINHSKQLNWGLEKIKFNTSWILRIDADEIISKNFKEKIHKILNNCSSEISGISLNRKLIFLNKEITIKGFFPHKTLRIWKTGKGYCEDAWMDEQIKVDGKLLDFDDCITDYNLNGLSWWIKKHKNYSIREAINYLIIKTNRKKFLENNRDKSKLNKNLKYKIYYNFPLFIRPFLLFFYSYFLKLGFFNGWKGLIFCFLEFIWFRFLVDVNIYQIRKIIRKNKISLEEAIKIKYGYTKI